MSLRGFNVPNIVTGSFLQATCNYTYAGQKYMNTFHYRATFTGGPLDSGALITDFHAAFFSAAGSVVDKLLLMIPDNMTLSEIWYQWIYETRYRKVVYPVAELGLWDVAAQTGNVAAVITRSGDVAKRYAQGRIYVPIAQDPTAVVSGATTTAMFDAQNDLAFSMGQPIVTTTPDATWEPVLMNPGRQPVYTPVTHNVSMRTVRALTRRTVGHGI